MPRYRVLPYRQGSRGARALADAMNGRVLKIDGTSRFTPRRDDIVVNWGNTNENFPFGRAGWLNDPTDIREASNKLLFFQKMMRANCGDFIPAFWTRREDIPDGAFPIVCRTVLAGHSGAGIVIANTRAELVPCSLYVKYIKKQQEYRIHVGVRNERVRRAGERHGAEVRQESITISVQRKARRLETPDHEVNWAVRNHQNGFIYVRGDANPPDCVIEAAQRCRA
jgi:hypothetical protein